MFEIWGAEVLLKSRRKVPLEALRGCLKSEVPFPAKRNSGEYGGRVGAGEVGRFWLDTSLVLRLLPVNPLSWPRKPSRSSGRPKLLLQAAQGGGGPGSGGIFQPGNRELVRLYWQIHPGGPRTVQASCLRGNSHVRGHGSWSELEQVQIDPPTLVGGVEDAFAVPATGGVTMASLSVSGSTVLAQHFKACLRALDGDEHQAIGVVAHQERVGGIGCGSGCSSRAFSPGAPAVRRGRRGMSQLVGFMLPKPQRPQHLGVILSVPGNTPQTLASRQNRYHSPSKACRRYSHPCRTR